MSRSDPLDGKIREALADVVSQAPVAPDFDDIETTEAPQSKRPSRRIVWAAAAAVAAVFAVIAGVTITGTDDTAVDTGMGPEEPPQDGSAVTPCEESASHIASDADVLVFLQPDSSKEQQDEVARLIEAVPDAEIVRFLDQDATYDEFRDIYADSPILESVTAEILLPRFELSVAGPSPVDAVADALRAEPAVREVIDADRPRAEIIAQCAQRETAADDDAERATTTTEAVEVVGGEMPLVDDDRWGPYVMGSGGLTGTRTSPDGRSLVVTFVGGAPYTPGKACTVAYRAEVTESAGEVTVQLFSVGGGATADSENVVCTLEGYFRSVEVGLDAPLGDRTVHEKESRRRLEVFDGSLLAEPTLMPEGWTLLSEQAGFPDPESAAYWQRTWGAEPPPSTGDSCTPSDSPISLTQGPAAGPDRDVSYLRPVSTYDVNGAPATYYEGGPTTPGQVALIWETAGQSFVLDSGPSCFGEGAASLDRLLKFARALAVPGS
jgi:hypothetical protein